MALTKKDHEAIALIAAQAAVAAVQAMGAAPAAAAPVAPAVELPDDPEDEAAARRSEQEERAKLADLEETASEIVPQLMQLRHFQVFEWLKVQRGVSTAGLLRQILRNAIALETPNWREANGGGGASTKSVETMARLKGE